MRREEVEAALSEQVMTGPSRDGDGQDVGWIRASQRGDAVAFNRLVLKWEKRIFNLSLRMLQNPEEAAESTQEVFLAAFTNLGKFRLDARFSTWLYRIAVNQSINRLRRRPPGVHYSLDDEAAEIPWGGRLPTAESQEGELLREESRRNVREALERLSPEQRAVVELKFFQDLTFEEIARVLDVPLSTIKSRLYTGLEALKCRLTRTGAGP